MNNQQTIQEYIESKMSEKDFLIYLKKLNETELLDFLNCLLGKYGGIIASEILLEFSDFL